MSEKGPEIGVKTKQSGEEFFVEKRTVLKLSRVLLSIKVGNFRNLFLSSRNFESASPFHCF